MRLFAILFFIFFFSLHDSAFALTLDAPPASSKYVQQEEKQTGIKGFFSKLFGKKKKEKVEVKFDITENGYKGSLPNTKSEFNYKLPKSSKPDGNKENAEEYLPDEFQKSKIDDPLFLDVILNKDKPLKYTVDMLRVMRFLESFRPVVANHEPIQKFNANVNLLDLHAKRIEQLYSEKPEGMSPSYVMLLDLAYKAKILGNLKYDANYYSKFSPVAGTQYDPTYLAGEDDKFLIELDKIIFQIRQLNN